MAGLLRGVRQPSAETREVMEQLSFLVTDFGKLRMQRKELAVVLISIMPKGSAFSEEQATSLMAIASQKEIQEAFEIVIKNLQSIQKSVEDVLYMKEVKTLIAILGQELQALVTLSGILKGVRKNGMQGVQISNLRSAVTALSSAVVKEEKATKGVLAAQAALAEAE